MRPIRDVILNWFVKLENWYYESNYFSSKQCHGFSPMLPQGIIVARTEDWIGVDFDGTLVTYDGWKGCEHCGSPIMPMVNRVKAWLDKGIEVRIFTARVGPVYPHQVVANRETIQRFCRFHFGRELSVTHEKDQKMLELWDDKAANPNCLMCNQ